MTWFRRGATSLYHSGSFESHSRIEDSPFRGPVFSRGLDSFISPHLPKNLKLWHNVSKNQGGDIMDKLSRAEQLEQKRTYWKQLIDSWQETGLKARASTADNII